MEVFGDGDGNMEGRGKEIRNVGRRGRIRVKGCRGGCNKIGGGWVKIIKET